MSNISTRMRVPPRGGPDPPPVVGSLLQRPRGAPAVGVDRAGLGDDALVDELPHDIADRGGAEAGGPAQVLPAARLSDEQRPQQNRAVVPAQIADGRPFTFRHGPVTPHFLFLTLRTSTQCNRGPVTVGLSLGLARNRERDKDPS